MDEVGSWEDKMMYVEVCCTCGCILGRAKGTGAVEIGDRGRQGSAEGQ